jgi:VCBS repeat-containing protein
VSYTPAANYNGPDSFTYTIGDGNGGTATATVNVTVTAVPDAPVANANSYSVAEDAVLTVTAPGVLGNDSDPDGGSLTAVLVTGPAHGTLNLSAEGNFSYTPAANYNGPDSFTYRASDGTLTSAAATVTLAVNAVNDAPTSNNQSVMVQGTTPKSITLTATDIDGNPLTYSIAANPAHGSLSGSGANRVYTAQAGYQGSDSFTFVANDGTVNSNTATVTIQVMSANNRPPVAVTDEWLFFDEDTPTAATVSASDPDGNPLTYAIVTPPAHGTLSGVGPNYIYTPEPNFNGWDYFTFVASDGLAQSNVATMNFWIWEVNDAPAAQDLQVQTSSPVSDQVIVTDAESDYLFYMVEQEPQFGTVTLDPDTGAFTYTPGPGYTGHDSFTFVAYDWELVSNSGTVTIVGSHH